MAYRKDRSWFGVVILTILCGTASAQDYPWTVLIPENDSRDEETQLWDEFDSQSLVRGMNETEDLFHHHLVWDQVKIKDLFSAHTPFCELRFDAVKPLKLTDDEKVIIREYFQRGGFILFQEDAYPYEQDEFWAVKSWPVIDFLTRELPAVDPNFKVEKITDAHELFHSYYNTQTAAFTVHELRGQSLHPQPHTRFIPGPVLRFCLRDATT